MEKNQDNCWVNLEGDPKTWLLEENSCLVKMQSLESIASAILWSTLGILSHTQWLRGGPFPGSYPGMLRESGGVGT